MNAKGYAIRVNGRGLVGGVVESEDEARLNAQGYLMSCSEAAKVDVVPIAPGTIGGVGPAIATVGRNRRGGPLKWTEHARAATGAR